MADFRRLQGFQTQLPCAADTARNQSAGQVERFTATFLPGFLPLSAAEMETHQPLFVPVGSNSARLFGMDARDRACRLAANMGLPCADEAATGRGVVLANMAFAWDPAWLREISGRPGTLLTIGGQPVLAHVPAGQDTPAV